MDWLVIADDLTGACDTGAGFAASGLLTRVLLDHASPVSPVDVIVLTTESRHLSAVEAAHKVKAALMRFDLSPGCRVYKKVDSTLRGQPAAEFNALFQQLQPEQALVCPAFPEQARTVRGGRVFVSGVPLEETIFSQEAAPDRVDFDLLNWLATGSRSLLIPLEQVRLGVEAVIAFLVSSGPAVFAADAETQADLRILARAGMAAGIRLFCGSAGLARALVGPARSYDPVPADAAETGPILVIAGSRSQVTLRQAALAEQVGLAVIKPSLEELRIGNEVEELIRRICYILETEKSLVISTARLDYRPGEEQAFVQTLGQMASGVSITAGAGGLVLTGGDIAAGVCRALNCSVIELSGEVTPGIAWGRLVGGDLPGLRVVTKAGGFGADDAIVQAVQFLLR